MHEFSSWSGGSAKLNWDFISQKKYAKETLERFGMEYCKPVKNPIVPGSRLAKDEGGTKIDSTTDKKMVGSLMYLTVTRPDCWEINTIPNIFSLVDLTCYESIKCSQEK